MNDTANTMDIATPENMAFVVKLADAILLAISECCFSRGDEQIDMALVHAALGAVLTNTFSQAPDDFTRLTSLAGFIYMLTDRVKSLCETPQEPVTLQ